MGVTNPNKIISNSQIKQGKSFDVTISLSSIPNIQSKPTDIIMILDGSSSMSGSKLADLKNGAKKFVDIIDEFSDGKKDGIIGNGTKIGIVSFGTNALKHTIMTDSVSLLNLGINNLNAKGKSNHHDAFVKAIDMFDKASPNEKILVMFTDGITTIGADPITITNDAKTNGIKIYCIGLYGNNGLDEKALNDWASTPSSTHVTITSNSQELESIFETLAQNISNCGATNISIKDTVNSNFKILSVDTPTKGTAQLIDEQNVDWQIDALGVTNIESASLTFSVQDINSPVGLNEVNKSIIYSDTEGNKVAFPSPKINILSNSKIITEECPTPINIQDTECKDKIAVNAGDIVMQSQGKILEVSAIIKNVCPQKQVAVAVLVSEIDNLGIEHKRGMKTLLIPPHSENTCQDIEIKCIKFILPEELDLTSGTQNICNARNFNTRVFANYIDSDYDCCQTLKP